jgi:hypothetical protein
MRFPIAKTLVACFLVAVGSQLNAQEMPNENRSADIPQIISFNRDVRPILSDRCFHCHGPDEAGNEVRDTSFRLDTQSHAWEAIEPGDLEGSELHARIRSNDPDDMMPPPSAVRQLTERDKEILDAWIKAGAKFESHWAFEPVAEKIDMPQVDSAWPRNVIDRFVWQKQRSRGLVPNEPASRAKWLRRVTFDLTGLPPTVQQVEDFVNDENDSAFEVVVDRLLGSDACAERLASEWLDVARYADSYGYQVDSGRRVWPYRDWVIGAFQKNMPYDQFVTEQLAGDLLDNPTRDQMIATCFNRLHSHKKEGGVEVEEFRFENVADRTQTVGTAFLGLTMECCRCHDHKYDPLKAKEYYQLSAFFSNIDENGTISYFTDATPTPAYPLPTDLQTTQLENDRRLLETAAVQLAAAIEQAEPEFEVWKKNLNARQFDLANQQGLAFTEAFDARPDKSKAAKPGQRENRKPKFGQGNKIVPGRFGKALKLTGDDPVLFPDAGKYARHDPFSYSIWIKPEQLLDRALIYRRSRAWDDAGSRGYELLQIGDRLNAKLVHFWPGNAICIETDSVIKAGQWHHVVVTYDGSSKAAGLNVFVDGKRQAVRVIHDQLTRLINRWSGGMEEFAIGERFRDRGFKNGSVDQLHAFDRELSAFEVVQLFDSEALNQLLENSADHQTQLREHYMLVESKPVAEAREKLREARSKLNATLDSIASIMVMRESKTQRKNYILNRGVYNEPTVEVSAGTPHFLPPMPEGPRNRLTLANWLTSSNHPLTARVTVNRYWQMLFGNGLVRTPEDFGLQGAMPTHPELLDWLARDFMSNGWDLRRLLKMIVLSSTYRQSAVVTSEVRELDPENLWLARMPANRLSAEMIRDNVLAVSGLLNPKVGGVSVKPYEVALAYKPMAVDKGDRLYRRSLYTYWKRTAPAPVMVTMNSSKRDVCRVRREITNSPLQALVLLNGSQFVEAARVLGQKLIRKHGGPTDELIREAFVRLTSREPEQREIDILKLLVSDQIESFSQTPDAAMKYLAVGEAELDADVDPSTLAAVAVMVNAIMNLDESVRQR